ncbi:MAG: S1C family serine protease [Velocimicrobium sp.]
MDEFNREDKNNDTNNENNTNNTNNEYVFWAEAAAKNGTQANTPQYEAPNYQSNFTQEASNYGSTYEAGGAGGGNKKKHSDGFGKSATKFIACAVAFGLVAGLVFQGVNRTADTLFPTKNSSTANTIQVTTPVATTSESTTSGTSSDLTQLVENTMPSIVSITSTMTQDYSYFGQVYSQEFDGSGSGIIVGQNDKEILIVTNNHVVENAKAIAVNFINDKVYEAKVKGTDSTADLAVVAVETADVDKETLSAIKIATLGNSDNVKVGQMAIAIGNALGSGQSVTVGYVSAKNRQVNTTSTTQGSQLELLQTDAAINPGNSGGALLNIKGEVIGINDLKYADTDVEGMGYAIPISEATPIINELMNREVLADDEKGYLGISGNDITKDNNYYDMPIGVYVHEVAAGGAAEEAGIKKGDIITAINGATAKTIEAVQEKVNNTRAGTKITVAIMRSVDGEYKKMDVTVTLKDSKTLNNLSKTDNSAQGNFGYQSDDNNTNEQDNSTQQTPEQAPEQAPDQNSNGSDNNQTNQDINDRLQDFFNQFNQ